MRGPSGFCLDFDGDIKKDYARGEYYIACDLTKGSGTGACAFRTYDKAGRPCMELPGPACVVKLLKVSPSSKDKVLSGCVLLEDTLPTLCLESRFVKILEELEAPPFVWKQVITGYPGLAIMLDLRAEAETISAGIRQNCLSRMDRSSFRPRQLTPCPPCKWPKTRLSQLAQAPWPPTQTPRVPLMPPHQWASFCRWTH